ncbi:MAG: pyruvate formate lyase family protein, partial [bacterium]
MKNNSKRAAVLLKGAIDVRDFVYKKLKPYNGNADFLVSSTKKTAALWEECKKLIEHEKQNDGVLDIDAKTVSTITSHQPGYIKKDLEAVVGLQTDAPLKRAIKPFGGIRMAQAACSQYGFDIDPEVKKIFNEYRKTHNDGVFSAYTEQMRKLRKAGILTGLPDAYARGRIIGDYRRVALYGIDRLIEEKKIDLLNIPLSGVYGGGEMTDEIIRLREEISEQIKALELMKLMAVEYGFDISMPAKNAREAVQWTYFGYLAAIKEQDG